MTKSGKGEGRGDVLLGRRLLTWSSLVQNWPMAARTCAESFLEQGVLQSVYASDGAARKARAATMKNVRNLMISFRGPGPCGDWMNGIELGTLHVGTGDAIL